MFNIKEKLKNIFKKDYEFDFSLFDNLDDKKEIDIHTAIEILKKENQELKREKEKNNALMVILNELKNQLTINNNKNSEIITKNNFIIDLLKEESKKED